MDDQLKKILARRRATESGVFESAPKECAADATESSARRLSLDENLFSADNQCRHESSAGSVPKKRSTWGGTSDFAEWQKTLLAKQADPDDGVFENKPQVSSADFKTAPAEESAGEIIEEKSLFVQRLSEVGVLRPQSSKNPDSPQSNNIKTLPASSKNPDTIDSGSELSPSNVTDGECSISHSQSMQEGLDTTTALKQVMEECSEIDFGVCQNKPSRSQADFQSTSIRHFQKLTKFRSEAIWASQQGMDGSTVLPSKLKKLMSETHKESKTKNEAEESRMKNEYGESEIKNEAEGSRMENEDGEGEIKNEAEGSRIKPDVQKCYDEATCSPLSGSVNSIGEVGSPEEENSSTFIQEGEEEYIESDDFDDDDLSVLSEISFLSYASAIGHDSVDDDLFKDSENAAETLFTSEAAQQLTDHASEQAKGQGLVFLVEATQTSLESGLYLAALRAIESCLESMPTTYTSFMIVLFGAGVQFFSFNTKSGTPRVLNLNVEDLFLPEPLSALMVDPVPWREHLKDLLRALKSFHPPEVATPTEEAADSWNAVLSVAVDAAAFAGGGDVISFNVSLPNEAQYGSPLLSARLLPTGKTLLTRFHRSVAKECRSRGVAISPLCLRMEGVRLDVTSLQWLSWNTSSVLKFREFSDADVAGTTAWLAGQVERVWSRSRFTDEEAEQPLLM